MYTKKPGLNSAKLDRVVVDARRYIDERERGYREQALKLYPWICARCGREFDLKSVRELTVHHKNHNHDDNPPDGSNWELLCLYCHDNEHARYLSASGPGGIASGVPQDSMATYKPFADLSALLKGNKPSS